MRQFLKYLTLNLCVPVRAIYSATATATITFFSVADTGCLSRILIFTHPGSRISDPGSKNRNKREGWKKISWKTFFCSHKFLKIENYFIFGMRMKKIWANFQRILELFIQNIVTKLSKTWVWDPGSEIRDPKKTYSGSRIQGSERHRIPDPDPQHCISYCFSINM